MTRYTALRTRKRQEKAWLPGMSPDEILGAGSKLVCAVFQRAIDDLGVYVRKVARGQALNSEEITDLGHIKQLYEEYQNSSSTAIQKVAKRGLTMIFELEARVRPS